MNPAEIRSVIQQALNQGCFFAGQGSCCHVQYNPNEDIAWEILDGHLLDSSHTRLRKDFESWNVFLDETATLETQENTSNAPVVSIKFDPVNHHIHVTRNILSYAWEAYEELPNVIRSRETRKWVPELIGTIDPATHPFQEIGRAHV